MTSFNLSHQKDGAIAKSSSTEEQEEKSKEGILFCIIYSSHLPISKKSMMPMINVIQVVNLTKIEPSFIRHLFNVLSVLECRLCILSITEIFSK